VPLSCHHDVLRCCDAVQSLVISINIFVVVVVVVHIIIVYVVFIDHTVIYIVSTTIITVK